jgi:hypothetical protein
MFLSGIWSWPRRGEFKHFQSGPERGLHRVADIPNDEEFHAELKRLAEENPSLFADDVVVASLGLTKHLRRLDPTDYVPSLHTVDDLLRKGGNKDRKQLRLTFQRLAKKYLRTFFSLLEKAATGEHPTEPELRTVLDALNNPLHLVRWHKQTRKLEAHSMGVREICGHLIEYLNLVADCGPVHAKCAECSFMFMRKTGDRKFCHDCSKRHQTYQYRKEYLLKKKKEYYQRDVAEERSFRKRVKRQKQITDGSTQPRVQSHARTRKGDNR